LLSFPRFLYFANLQKAAPGRVAFLLSGAIFLSDSFLRYLLPLAAVGLSGFYRGRSAKPLDSRNEYFPQGSPGYVPLYRHTPSVEVERHSPPDRDGRVRRYGGREAHSSARVCRHGGTEAHWPTRVCRHGGMEAYSPRPCGGMPAWRHTRWSARPNCELRPLLIAFRGSIFSLHVARSSVRTADLSTRPKCGPHRRSRTQWQLLFFFHQPTHGAVQCASPPAHSQCGGIPAWRHILRSQCGGMEAERHSLALECGGMEAERHTRPSHCAGIEARRHTPARECAGMEAWRHTQPVFQCECASTVVYRHTSNQ